MNRNATDIVDLKRWIGERHPEMEAQVHVSDEDPIDMLHANELGLWQYCHTPLSAKAAATIWSSGCAMKASWRGF